MSHRLLLMSLLALLVLGVAACAPAEEPMVEEEPAAAPPPPPPTLYDIGEVDIVTEAPDFTSRNVTFMGVGIGDSTNDITGALGEPDDTPQNAPDHYVSSYEGGGLLLHTFKMTGELQKIEILTRLADELASPALSAWLEEGDLEAMRELMGPEEDLEAVAATQAVEYVYDSRGIRFIEYPDQRGIRFSTYRD